MILLVTNQQDITRDLVVQRLRERGLPYIRFNTEKFLENGGFRSKIGIGFSSEAVLQWNGKEINLHEVSSVWYRRPKLPRSKSMQVDMLSKSFAQSEGDAIIRNLLQFTSGLWVSRPEAIQVAEAKLLQLHRANDLGFTIPRTLVTSDPEEAKTFVKNRRVVAKALGKSSIDDPSSHKRWIIYTSELRERDVNHLDSIHLVPTLFQERIAKAADIRVTVVGQELFATEIHTPKDCDEVDWRKLPASEVEYRSHRLPSYIADRLKKLVKSFDLQFGAIDLLVDFDGNYVFIELNPNGQWGWLELLNGDPISLSLVNLLSGHTLSL